MASFIYRSPTKTLLVIVTTISYLSNQIALLNYISSHTLPLAISIQLNSYSRQMSNRNIFTRIIKHNKSRSLTCERIRSSINIILKVKTDLRRQCQARGRSTIWRDDGPDDYCWHLKSLFNSIHNPCDKRFLACVPEPRAGYGQRTSAWTQCLCDQCSPSSISLGYIYR